MKNRSALTIAFVTVFIDLMGFGILIPILPSFANRELGISEFGIGVIVASFSFVQFIFNPVLGKLSDRIGRKPIMLISLLISSASYVIFAFSHSFALLLISRVLAGLGGSNIAVAQAYIADVTEKHERAKGMGLIGVAFGMGFVFGPIIGGVLSKFGYAAPGIGSAGLSFIAFLYALIFLKETVTDKHHPSARKSIRVFDLNAWISTLKIPGVGLLIVIFFIITFSMANIYGTFALLGYQVHSVSDQQIGYMFGFTGIISSLIQGGFIRLLSEKISEKFLIVIGTFSMAFGLGLIPYGGNIWGLAFVLVFQAIGTGILQPTVLSMISKYSPDKEQGAILGINQSLSALARVLGPLWGGFSYEMIGYQFPFLTGGIIMLFTFLFSVSKLRVQKSN